MRVVFFGSGKYVLPILEVLRENFEFALVVTTEKTGSDPVITFCRESGIPSISVTTLSTPTIRYTLKTKRCPLGVLANFGLIIPSLILKRFPSGILNIHPSFLPKYRGPTPGQTAILNSDKEIGVTIIKLDEEVDHGPIVAQIKEPILPIDTAQTLYERLFKIGAKILPQTINQYIKGQIKVSPQDHRKATFTKSLTRQDGYIDLQNLPPPDKLDRMIRAYYPWPGVWSKLKVESGKLKIVKFLPDKKLQVEGGKPMSIRDFLNGYPEAKVWLSQIYPKLTP